MNYNFNEYRFPSADGKNTIYAEIYTPKHAAPKGIVQLAHGMIDYTGRYTALASFLCEHGFIFAGNHHLGHGKSVGTGEDFGFFAERDGYKYVLEDINSMNKYLHKTHPDLPVILLGHSMGSFISRLYVAEHPTAVSGLIIHGTGGPMGAILPLGKGVVKLIMLMRGRTHRSTFVKKLAFTGYNSHYPKEEGSSAWLTRDLAMVADRSTDEFTSFIFTVSAYLELFRMLGEANGKSWFESFPKGLRTLIMSGDEDPVGAYGKGPEYIYGKLSDAKVADLSLKLYPGARHELFNETNREEVFRDLIFWLDGASV